MKLLRRLGLGLALAVPAYIAGAFGGGLLVRQFSSNVHDRSLEAAMTGAFVTGPLLAVAGFIAGLLLAGRSRNRIGDQGDAVADFQVDERSL